LLAQRFRPFLKTLLIEAARPVRCGGEFIAHAGNLIGLRAIANPNQSFQR
jgi:hypothetical protein